MTEYPWENQLGPIVGNGREARNVEGCWLKESGQGLRDWLLERVKL